MSLDYPDLYRACRTDPLSDWTTYFGQGRPQLFLRRIRVVPRQRHRDLQETRYSYRVGLHSRRVGRHAGASRQELGPDIRRWNAVGQRPIERRGPADDRRTQQPAALCPDDPGGNHFSGAAKEQESRHQPFRQQHRLRRETGGDTIGAQPKTRYPGHSGWSKGNEYQHAGAAARTDYLRSQADVMKRFMRAYVESIHYYLAHREEAVRKTMQLLKLDDRQIGEFGFDIRLKTLPVDGKPTVKGIQLCLDDAAEDDPKAKTISAQSLIDLNFLLP